MKINSLSALNDAGIVLHSFSGDAILFVQNCQPVEPANFHSFLRTTDQPAWDQTAYLEAFEKVQQSLHSGKFQKLILSRIKAVETTRDALSIFSALNSAYANTFNYIFSSNETGTWIGASPELLLHAYEKNVNTVSLAGTKPADGLSEWTSKEKEEQKLVTDFILDAFTKNEITQVVATAPYSYKAGPVDHLKTDISGVVPDKKTVFSLLKDLHPTPATCGIPQTESKIRVAEIEAHKREFYTGFIGVLTSTEKTFFVNLRCMELQKNKALLFVGGGITKASDGEREWLETERKSETLKRVL